MAQKDKGTIFAFGLLLVYCTYTQGLSAGLKLLKQISNAISALFKMMFSLVVQFPDEFGLTDWLCTRVIYLAITVCAAGLAGYAFTSREKKKLLGIIGSLVSVVSLMLTFSRI